MNPRKKPDFKRWLSQAYVRLKESWRRPRARQSKVRRKKKGKPKAPKIGYGAPRELRFLHPSGYREVLVRNVKELERVDPKEEAVRIAATVGRKKRGEILKRAEELGLKVLNP